MTDSIKSWNDYVIESRHKVTEGLNVSYGKADSIQKLIKSSYDEFTDTAEMADDENITFFINAKLMALVKVLEQVDVKSLKDGIALYNKDHKNLLKANSKILKGIGNFK